MVVKIMMRCPLVLINAERTSGNNYILYYLPYSITTIKLQITNLEQRDMDILIHPLKFQNDEEFCCGFDDDRSGITVIWGGGDEEGIKTFLRINDSKYVFAAVLHDSRTTPSNYKLTLNIRKTVRSARTRYEEETMTISLLPLSDMANIVREEENQSKEQITFHGSYMSYYCPRWFPEMHKNLLPPNSSGYYVDCSLPDLKINIQRKKSGYNEDKIWLEYGSGRNIGTISGDMDGATLHNEIFKLYSNVYVIRLWFIWISKKQFHDKANLEIGMRSAERGITSPELPDCERFDIVLNESGRIVCIGTDFHWQEYWYALSEGQSSFNGSLSKYVFPVEDTLSRLYIRASQRYKNYQETNSFSTDYDMTLMYLKRLCESDNNLRVKTEDINLTAQLIFEGEKQKSNIEYDERGKNFLRSHVPYINNGYIIPYMVTDEVTYAT
jgi:hypothetical protein